jgi:hypothetical protein
MVVVARQVLSLVAGGAIDEWLLSNLRRLRQEHTLARALHLLQQQLWPGGAWFQTLPEHQLPVRACPRPARTPADHTRDAAAPRAQLPAGAARVSFESSHQGCGGRRRSLPGLRASGPGRTGGRRALAGR